MRALAAGVVLALAFTTGSVSANAPRKRSAPRPLRLLATAYCDSGKTKTGTRARHGVIAADPRVLPLGSTVRIHGVGPSPITYVVEDTGSAIKGHRVDIFMRSCAAARRFGRRPVIAHLLRTAAADAQLPIE